MKDGEITPVLDDISDCVVVLNYDRQPLQTTLSANSFNTIPEESPPTLNIPLQTRRTGVYTDVTPNAPFWVQINPKPNFNRDDYQLDDEEFNIVGIVGEIGQGEDLLYEVQFQDDHTAIVPPLLSSFAQCSCQ
jgi:hypothetical protein